MSSVAPTARPVAAACRPVWIARALLPIATVIALGGVATVHTNSAAAAPAPASGGPPLTAPAAAPPAAPASGRLFVLLINGGGSREDNFQSHLAHLRELNAYLLAANVAKDRITILSSDGADPRPDLATRQESPHDLWLLEGTPLAEILDEPLRFENSTIPGMTLLPATRASLAQYLAQLRAKIAAPDTLFVYVTDHGNSHPRDPLRNQITLWGPREGINVRQLGAELSQLPAGVRVVTVMSQCFSGGFARLRETMTPAARDRVPVCGYFASPADRPAYGCFPEADRSNRTGHAFTVIDALTKSRRLPEIHAEVLIHDRSPDVPQRTSDVFLHDLIRRAAERAGSALDAYGDRLLDETRGANKLSEFALADRLGRAYGLAAPLSLTAMTKHIDEISATRTALGKHQSLWESALAESTRAQLDEFLNEHPAWRPRLRPQILRGLTDDARRSLRRELLDELRRFADARAPVTDIAERLVARVDEATALAYRMDVREAAFQRIRILLVNAAARAYLVSAYPGHERQELARIESCESLELPSAPKPTGTPPPAAAPLPPVAKDTAAATGLRPSYLGIAFRAPSVAVRGRFALADGAALITAVVPRSPAAVGALAPGDIIVGVPGQPFVRENQVRAFTMLSPPATPLQLEVLRRGKRLQVEVTLTTVPTAPAPR